MVTSTQNDASPELLAHARRGPCAAPTDAEIPVDQLREGLEPMIGQLPYIIGLDPFFVFPSAVVMMTFLSFFIGVFLQLLWEELPITEPL